MLNHEFKSLVIKMQARIDSLCEVKGKEYGSDIDRLANFKRAAALERNQPEQALLHMVAKQITSIFDIIDVLKVGDATHPDDFLEKTGDVIVYMILLQALIEERYYGNTNQTR